MVPWKTTPQGKSKENVEKLVNTDLWDFFINLDIEK